MSQLRKAVKQRGNVCKKMHKQAIVAGKAPSLQVRDLAVRSKITSICLDLLTQLNQLSGRFAMLYGDGSRVPSEKEKDYVCKLFFQSNGRKVKPSTVFGYCKEFRSFLGMVNIYSGTLWYPFCVSCGNLVE